MYMFIIHAYVLNRWSRVWCFKSKYFRNNNLKKYIYGKNNSINMVIKIYFDACVKYNIS